MFLHFIILELDVKRSSSIQGHHLNKSGSFQVYNAINNFKALSKLVLEKKISKNFTI